jgi:Ca-activated chloride channel family protein
MIFLKPEYFSMMLIPALILFYFIIMQKSALESYFDKNILEKLRFDNGALGRVGRNMMLFVALLLMIVALARPVKEKQDIEIKSKTIDMMVAIDVSKSMMAGDFYPSRLAFAKKRFVEFVDSFKEANIGVIAFSSEGFLVSPMTQDSATLKYLVHNLSLDSMTLRGTNLLLPIEKGKEFLKRSEEKIIIIFTDGGDNSDFKEEIERAKAYNESIYIYAVATPKGAVIKEGKEVLKDKQGNIVISKLNEGIKQLAFETGGAYIVGNYEDESISLMVEDIKKKFKMHEQKEKKIKEYRELFYYPLSLAILFLLFAFHSLPRHGSTIMILSIMIVLLQTPVEAKIFDFLEISKAKEAYEKGEFKEAVEEYKRIVKSNKTPESIYDLANAQYKAKQYKEALKNYANVVAKTEALQYKKAFNSGNAHFQLGAYEKAISAYERAQKVHQSEDVAHNLALAKKRLKEKRKKEQKREKKEQNKQKDKNKESKKGEQKKGDATKQKQKKASSKKEDEKKKSQQKQEAKEKKSKKEPEISKKEEKMWQKHLEQMRPKTMPMKFKMRPAKRRDDEKPW